MNNFARRPGICTSYPSYRMDGICTGFSGHSMAFCDALWEVDDPVNEGQTKDPSRLDGAPAGKELMLEGLKGLLYLASICSSYGRHSHAWCMGTWPHLLDLMDGRPSDVS